MDRITTGSEHGSDLLEGHLRKEEVKLLRRLRGLHAGVHLVIITTDGSGLVSVALVDSAKSERLRAATEA